MKIHRHLNPIALFVLIFISSSAIAQTTTDINTYNRFMKRGSEQFQAGDYPAARDAFNEALGYHEAGAQGHLGLGLAYFHLHEDKYAERELSRAAALDPAAGEAYQWLGELSYRNDDLETAVKYWEKALELNPAGKVVRARLERVRKEHVTEKDFSRDVTSHFLVKYEGREKIEAGRIILRLLEEAYGEVGRSLSSYPDREIQVILYSSQQFQEVTDAPGWSGGIYDGKIRIPIGGIETGDAGPAKASLSRVHPCRRACTRAALPHLAERGACAVLRRTGDRIGSA